MGIKAKFIIPTTVIIVIISVAILTTSVFLFFRYINDSAVEQIEDAADTAAGNIEAYKTGVNEAAVIFSQDPNCIGMITGKKHGQLLTYLGSFINDPSTEFAVVTDADGNVLADTRGTKLNNSFALSLASVRSALVGEPLTVIDKGSDIRLSIQSGRPVYNSQGQLIGTITAGIRMDTDPFADNIKSLIDCETAFILDNETIATTILNDDGSRASGIKFNPEIFEKVLSGTPFTGRADILGRTAVCRFVPLTGPDGTAIAMMYVGQYVEEAESVIASFLMVGLLITCITLAVSIATIHFIVNRIVNPIGEMTEAASALALGDTELAVSVKTHDEMKTLADAFNKIIDNTKKQIAIVEFIASGNQTIPVMSDIEITENIASGGLEATIIPRSEKDEMNRALEKLNLTIQAQAESLREEHSRILQMLSEIEKRDGIMQTVNRIADILLRAKPEIFDNTLNRCMEMMTCAVDADRMYIFKNYTERGKLYCTQIYEWSEKVKPFTGNKITVNVSYGDVAPETKRVLENGGCFHSLVRDLPESDRAQYEVQGILTIMIIPVFIHNVFWGFVGFDNCHAERLFSESEESIVRSGSMLIANALLRNEYTQSIHDASYELELALEEAEKANNAKGDFLASMSHEMRTPLNAIIGLSEIALDDASLSEDSASNLEKIHTSGSTLLSIVNDILDVSKIQSGKFEIIPDNYDVPSMVNDAVIQNVLRIGSRPIRFILNISEDMPAYLYGDELRIKQIINNLLSNAIKYTEEGSVTLTFSHEFDGDSVWLTVSVKDTGIGIKREHLENLFVDFVQFGSSSKHQAGGTGLGLSITKSLAEMMDGAINVESAYGEGSSFMVRLKQGFVSDTAIGPETAENISSLQYSSGRANRETRMNRIQMPYARVLLVDDNVTNLDVAKGLMKPYGMKIDCVTGGLDAVNAIKAGLVKYDAVFMDQMMPGMDGVEATRIIREETGTDYARNIPIIALTANAVAGSEEMFLRKGFQAFISKPIDIKRLDSVINRWVRNKKLEDKYANAYQGTGNASTGNSVWSNVKINGIDIAGALERFSGDDEILNVILRSYASSTRPLLKNLEEYLAAGKYEDYIIGIHGVKGTGYSVLAQEVGEAAEELEGLSKAGDYASVKTKHAHFNNIASALLDDLDKALADAEAGKRSPPPVETERIRFNFTAPGANVLIVDDNETNLKVALGLLKPLKMNIDTAENGQAALKKIRRDGDQYHLIFMDHFMPVMDGIEATRRLRKTEGDYFQNVPVIALSASDSSDARANFMQAGMNDFVTKPINTQEIQKKIKQWLPDYLIVEQGAEASREVLQEDSSEAAPDDLPVIEGINIEDGLRYSGSKELLMDLLGNFYKLIDIKSGKLEKCMADGLLRDVTIEVHALKSTARMIGAGELSKEFALMEEYGAAENAEALERGLPAVLEHYRSYKPILKPFGEAAETEKRPASAEELISLLQHLQTSMDNFDLDGADEILKQLDGLRAPDECQAKMEMLRAYVADVAMEEVIASAEDIINILKGK